MAVKMVYETSDGKIHKTLEEANVHEKTCDIKKALEATIKKYLSDDFEEGYSASTILNIILSNKDLFIQALTDIKEAESIIKNKK